MRDANLKSNSLANVVIALWAVILLIAFFTNRGDDVGRIGSLLGNLGGDRIFGYGIFDSFVGALVASLIAASWFGLGSLITKFVIASRSAHHSHVLELAIKTAVGAAAWSMIWFFLGIFGLYNGISAIIALIFGFVTTLLGLRRLREAKDESRVPERANILDRAMLLLIAVPLVLAFVAGLAPPTAKDTLLYHFAVPKAFIAQGSNAFVEGNIASYLALGTEMHTVWAMLLGSLFSQRAAEAAGGAVVWFFFPILLTAIFGFAREIGVERRWALIAVLMFASVPTVYHVAASAYIDIALALFITLAIYSLTRWWQTLEGGWLIFVAIFLGVSLSAKLTTLFVVAAFALLVLLRARDSPTARLPGSVATAFMTPGRIIAGGFRALILAGLIASPWYLRTWAETGSPVFPFYMSIWPGEAAGWDIERSNLFQTMNAQYGGAVKSPLDYLAAPWNLSVNAQPELASHFDGVLGVAFLIGLPVLVFVRWRTKISDEGARVPIKIGAGVAGIMFLFWLFSSQQLRYLLPILPILAISIAAAATRIAERGTPLYTASKYALSIAGIAGIVVSAAWFLQKAPVRVVLGGETRDQYLARNIDYYPYYQWLNTETEPNAKVWLINMRRDTYNLDRPYFSDYLFEDWTLRKMVWDARSVEELKAQAALMNVQYILTRHDVLLDYARSPIIDEQRPRPENEAKLKFAKAFLLDPARTIKADKKFSLVKVF